MLTPKEDMEITSLSKRGWSIAAIARHTGRDRKTVRAHLNGEREAGVRQSAVEDPFDRVETYVRQRLADDPHVWATVLFDEVVDLGYDRAYPTFTRKVRERDLRPHCEPCQSSTGRATVEIEHPAGEEIQWDWLELTETPWGQKAYVLVGALSHSSRCRGWFSESDDQAHLVEGMNEILRRHGGTPPIWRVDRMATVIKPGTADVQRSFVPVAKHYGATVAPCPPRHGNRKGVVEKAIHYITQGWWRTARICSMAEAQAGLDRFCIDTADSRPRGDSTVGEHADAERLIDPAAGRLPSNCHRGSNRRTERARVVMGQPLLGPTRPGRRPRPSPLASRHGHCDHVEGPHHRCRTPSRTQGRTTHDPVAGALRCLGEAGARRVLFRPAVSFKAESATIGRSACARCRPGW